MKCPKCGYNNEAGFDYCSECGTNLKKARLEMQAAAAPPERKRRQTAERERVYEYAPREDEIPIEYEPIGAWGYVGYSLLFGLPVIGLVFIIIFAISDKNYNRRNYARYYLILLLISFVILFIVAITGGIAAIGALMQYHNAI